MFEGTLNFVFCHEIHRNANRSINGHLPRDRAAFDARTSLTSSAKSVEDSPYWGVFASPRSARHEHQSKINAHPDWYFRMIHDRRPKYCAGVAIAMGPSTSLDRLQSTPFFDRQRQRLGVRDYDFVADFDLPELCRIRDLDRLEAAFSSSDRYLLVHRVDAFN